MAFLKLPDRLRLINTEQVADMTYSPAVQVEGDAKLGETHPTQPARLNIILSNGEVIRIEGSDADGLWEAFQTILQKPPQRPDWFLQTLIKMANRGIPMDLTLQLSGFLVSGELCTDRDYIDGFAEEFAAPLAGSDNSEEIKSSFARFRDENLPEDTDSVPNPGPAYIHLKNARFFNTGGNPIPGNRGVWWRGRLSQVGGFMIGRLNT